MKFKCRLGWHEYEKWNNEGTVKVMVSIPESLSDRLVERQYQVQTRHCVHCGIVKIRRERI